MSVSVMTMLRSDDKVHGFLWIHPLVTASEGRSFRFILHGKVVNKRHCLLVIPEQTRCDNSDI